MGSFLKPVYSTIQPPAWAFLIVINHLGARSEPNHWNMAGIVDVIGEDIYLTENKYWKDPNFSSLFFDYAYLVAHHYNRTLWMLEIESGPRGGFSAGPRYATKPLDIKHFVVEAIGYSAIQILYMGYQDWNSIPVTWGGLVDFHGNPNERYHIAAEVNQVIKAHEHFLLDVLPARAGWGCTTHTTTLFCSMGRQMNAFYFGRFVALIWHFGTVDLTQRSSPQNISVQKPLITRRY